MLSPQLIFAGICGAALSVLMYIFLGGPQKTVDFLVFILQETVFAWFHGIHEVTFNFPLRELYRHGPHLIGWEGLALSEVCNRITHFGGRDFWSRNMSECEEIYAGKEEAFLRTIRPLAYAILGILSFFVIRHLVIVYGESKRNRTDRAVLDAYHAFSTLVRIANRQAGQDPMRHRR